MGDGTKITGKNGSVTVDTSTVVKITDFEITKKLGASNVSDSGDAAAGYAVKVAQTFIDWSGKFSGYYLKGTTTLALGSHTGCIFQADTSITFAGAIFVTEVAIKGEIAGTNAVKIDVTFEGSGALTETNA
jgi:hypothetical protein